MTPDKIAYMAVTPDVNGPMPLSWVADLDTVMPAIKALGFRGIELQTRKPTEFGHATVKRKIDGAGLTIVLEPQNRINTDFLMTIAETIEFIRPLVTW